MRKLFVASLFLLLCVCISSAAVTPIGVVLLHGKQGTPAFLGTVANSLKGHGFLVATPEMPWSRTRIFDASYEDAMLEIDRSVETLKKLGAQKIVLGGHSLGANAALGYVARIGTIDGIMALAPGHVPESGFFRERLRNSVERAKAMVGSGRGDEAANFDDINQGRTLSVRATARVYLSYADPNGPAVMPKNAAEIKSPVPLLWVVGTRDVIYQSGREYVYDKAPRHPKSRYVVVDSDHINTPAAAMNEIVSWLNSLKD